MQFNRLNGRSWPAKVNKAWHCGKKFPSVDVLGRSKNCSNVANFNYLSALHHRDPVADLCRHAQIMGDEYQRH